jgi:hypothetical protein
MLHRLNLLAGALILVSSASLAEGAQTEMEVRPCDTCENQSAQVYANEQCALFNEPGTYYCGFVIGCTFNTDSQEYAVFYSCAAQQDPCPDVLPDPGCGL